MSLVPNHFPSSQKFEAKKKNYVSKVFVITLWFIGLDIFRESVSRVKCRGLMSLIDGNVPAVDNSGGTLSVMLQV